MRPTTFAGTIINCTVRAGDQYWVRRTIKLEVRVYTRLRLRKQERSNWFSVLQQPAAAASSSVRSRVFEFQTAQQK